MRSNNIVLVATYPIIPKSIMPNKYNNPQGSEDPNDRPLSPTQQSNRDEDLRYQREQAAENSGATNGLLIGGMLMALLGLGGFATYYYSNNQSPAVPTTIINNPPSSSPVTPAPGKQTKIIERTIEKAAPPQVIQVDKPVPAPPQIIEVPKPVLVPGETKVIEVPKPFAVPMTPGTAEKSANPKASPTPAAKASKSPTAPSTAASKSPESVNPSLPSSPNPKDN
jgi:hypothetical protein